MSETPTTLTSGLRRLRRMASTARGSVAGQSDDARLRAVEKKLNKLTRRDRLDDARVRAARLDYERAEIYLRLGSFTELERTRSCAKEPWTVEWIEQWIRPGETLYDIGANVGAYSLVAAMAPGVGARVVGGEGAYSTYGALSDNVVLNGVADRVTALPVALGARTTLETLHLRDLDAGAAMHDFGGTHVEGGHAYSQPVLTYRLDELIASLGLPPATHLKLDVDGTELAVIAGAADTLRSPALRSAMVEMDTGMEEPIGAALAEYGLELQQRSQRERPGPEKPPAYGIFVRRAADESRAAPHPLRDAQSRLSAELRVDDRAARRARPPGPRGLRSGQEGLR